MKKFTFHPAIDAGKFSIDTISVFERKGWHGQARLRPSRAPGVTPPPADSLVYSHILDALNTRGVIPTNLRIWFQLPPKVPHLFNDLAYTFVLPEDLGAWLSRISAHTWMRWEAEEKRREDRLRGRRA